MTPEEKREAAISRRARATDPGVDTWTDTAGRRHGGVGLRYNQVVTDIAPTCAVVPLGSPA
jgi:hypothetical protein